MMKVDLGLGIVEILTIKEINDHWLRVECMRIAVSTFDQDKPIDLNELMRRHVTVYNCVVKGNVPSAVMEKVPNANQDSGDQQREGRGDSAVDPPE